MEKGKWESARQQLLKSLRKDSLSIESEYGLARWYFADQNPERQIDSAYYYITSSLVDFKSVPLKQKEKLKRNHIDSVNMLELRASIDSAAFERARQINTEQAYSDFLKTYSCAIQKDNAIGNRNEVSYIEAEKANTYNAYYEYVLRYPDSKRKAEAQKHYEKLLLEDKTRDKKLKSYLAFRKEYPSNSYRREVEKQIFDIVTAGGKASSFLQFIHDFPASEYKTEAVDLLFYILKERDEKLPQELITDSIKNIIALNSAFWVPVLKDKKFGFIDAHGKEALPPQFESIKQEYKCGAVKDDILVTNEGLISRDGRKIAGSSTHISDIGFGFLKVGDSTCARVLHKSGRSIIADCSQDYTIVGRHYLVAKQQNKYALYAFNGRLLLKAQWQNIEVMESMVVLTRLGKKFIYTREQIDALADGNELSEDAVFDEVRSFGTGVIWVRNGSLEGILNARLEFVIPLERQMLRQTPFGLIRRKDDHFTLNGLNPSLEQEPWDKMKYYKQWLFLQRKQDKLLFDLLTKKVVAEKADSIWFDKGLAFVEQRDSLNVFISSEEPISLSKKAKVTFIKSRDSVQYFYADVKMKKVVFDIESGKKLFVADFDQAESLNREVFLIVKKNKKGLVGKAGKPIIPVEYDAIIMNQNHYLSLLKDKKFGLFDLNNSRLAKPIYDRNIIPLRSDILIAFKDGHYGLIGWDTKPFSKFEFDEIQPWSENVILVKKDFQWMLYDFRLNKVILEKVNDFQWIRNTHDDKVILAHRENYFGVVNNKKGVIIPLTFSEIVNLGTEEEPLYFTDKDIEEAAIHVVIYYNKNGELIRKQVYEEEEYNELHCENN